MTHNQPGKEGIFRILSDFVQISAFVQISDSRAAREGMTAN